MTIILAIKPIGEAQSIGKGKKGDLRFYAATMEPEE
jgi:hypothetical protein